MNFFQPKNNRLVGEVLRTNMTMSVRLATGMVVEVNGNAPKGSIVALLCTDLTKQGKLLGYEGYQVESTPKTLEQLVDGPLIAAKIPSRT